MAARRAHDPEVADSSPASATQIATFALRRINISGAGGSLLNSRNGEDCWCYTYRNILHNSLCCIRRLSSCRDNKISSRKE